MGHQISTKTQLGVSTKQNIQEKYYTNLFIKNLKSSHQFRKQLNSVCKRSSYLHYEWAQLLQTELKTGDLNKLYSEYQTTLKENCLREGKKEKIFCPTKIQRQFICRLDKQSKEETQMTAERLNKAFEQTKSYLMVMSWLHKMVTLSAKDQENKSSNISQEWDLNEEEHIYEMLFNLAQKTFRKVRRITPIKQCQNKSELSNLNLTRLIKKLTMQKLSFFEKQTIIAKIQEQLQVELIKLEQNVSSMKNILGEEVIYGHLRTVREVGHFDIDFLWKFFGEELS